MLLLAGDEMSEGGIRPIGVLWSLEGILMITAYIFGSKSLFSENKSFEGRAIHNCKMLRTT